MNCWMPPMRLIAWMLMLGLALPAGAQSIKLLHKAHDPFGFPRPEPGGRDVPTSTSLYLELGLEKPAAGDALTTGAIAVSLIGKDGKARRILGEGGRFAAGCGGWIRPAGQMAGPPHMALYLEPGAALDPLTTYTVQVAARSVKGVKLAPRAGRWSFRTGAGPGRDRVALALDLTSRPVRWRGAFFNGFCKPAFCNSADGLEESYAMMAEARKQAPHAWELQRDFWLTGADTGPENPFWHFNEPNIVRELETRRIAAMTTGTQGVLLKVEDFFGHEQYGIPAGRPLSDDYKPGCEVQIADGTSQARAKVLAVDDRAGTVLVGRFDPPPGRFKIDDPKTYSKKSDPAAPGLFPMGGCYLRRFKPCGTPRYYWGRLDREWDLARQYGHRLMPNFADAPGDLSATGTTWSPPKDYAELHEVARAITGHIIERYGGPASLEAVWCIFNEPDLGILFWHGTREELNQYYDYATDGVLRAFEEHGLDSGKVEIGGLELGAVFGLPGLEEFLRHCSPNTAGTAALNAAVADHRLDGKRSRRVEALCNAHGGKGAPCDFISVHAYNRSATMAGKLIEARRKALAIDAEYYKELKVDSHESAPDWMPPPDEAATEVFLGNGYYPAWCADVAWRQLTQGKKDARYTSGESILTFWPWPNGRFGGTNAATTLIPVDEDGDGKADRRRAVALPLFGFLNALGSMGSDYWVLPEATATGGAVAGFATRDAGACRVLLYAHAPADTQARGGREFTVRLRIAGLGWKRVNIEQTRFDRDHNAYLALARECWRRPDPQLFTRGELERLKRASQVRISKQETASGREDGMVEVTAEVAGNGVSFLVLRPALPD